MLPALLAEVGLPLLLRVAGAGLGRLETEAAKSAATAIDAVGRELTATRVPPDQMAAALRAVEETARAESRADARVLAAVNRTIRAESASADPYVRRWRPTFGYVVAAAWGSQMAALSWAIVTTPDSAPGLINAMTSLTTIWGVALGVLGVSVVKRSHDKARRGWD
jgi:hypothetical protein